MNQRNAVIFVEETEALALQAACELFECKPEALASKLLPSFGSGVAIRAAATDSGDNDASFRLRFSGDGVYAEITPAINGAPIDEAFVFYVIACRGVRGVDLKQTLSRIRSGERSIRIADAQAPSNLDECAVVSTSKDSMFALCQRYPAEEGGNPLTAEDIRKLAAQAGIAVPLNELALSYLLQSPVNNSLFVIAKGRRPVDGNPAKIEYQFVTSHDNMPKVLEGDKLDYRMLDLFENVVASQVLVTKTPATQGVEGVTVKGKPLSAKNGRDYPMPRGRNTVISEDGLQMFAETSGRVDIVNGKVVVSNIFETKDIDMSVGNVEFNGDIVIRGNVFSGFIVKAAGSIEVYGNVEAATLEAGGHIVLRQGMQGMDKGVLRAGGNVVCKYIERAQVYAQGTITADALIHSNIESEEEVNITGKRGIIIGGVIRANSMIVARTLGAVSHVPTILEVGASPALRARISELEAVCAKENQELSQMIMLMQRRMGTDTNENRLLVERARNTVYSLQQKLEEDMEDLEAAKTRFESATAGRVHALDSAFPGVRIAIGSLVYNVLTPVQYATFRLRAGEITYTACEYS